MELMAVAGSSETKVEPCEQEFGLPHKPEFHFKRDPNTQLFDDQRMVNELITAMDAPICRSTDPVRMLELWVADTTFIANFGPKNVPQCLKSVEILGILQARKW